MKVGACEECGEFETLYACDSCEQTLCAHCYGETRLPSCYDCLSAMEGPVLSERIQPGQRGGEHADRDGRKGGRFGSKAPQRGRVKF
ncbi:MAG: hypothetical protein COZ06_26605 [Armatimonadetes bacterium CG_4_10_14_3_um_filter_66_18]|nr:MAG: hypothetical protein AUJ96_09425 [Armatimonadetes bacterium CG2_30_66_41]PIU91024.1 MAG: hypothetical protein COS65_23320 [Armatimonadetes bacterium CG06_land_8_20_14_3_00_66_21]PIX42278.1 MAG: hypothetical protein COZ57_21595 [Armatimonadetes bacterium CG_4_8_14_3_um_filter_66_20]PIY41436.1 MAG: hypothetical protein COZ06_26605 [Armatimonadetes bacterium CG_4_10_14_3_um_filter_66_18]PIZ36519.1 MAG: hypothetical protein COY42_25465 [Armatimonadetes bacterium CG_4_10_14_0_8_um_filter_66_